MSEQQIVIRAAETGPAFWGPGDRYTFLITGEQTGGAYFVMEALVPPGGGPPPHIHRNEDETFYIVDGECSITIDDMTVEAKRGDFINIPRGVVHCFRNNGSVPARMIVTFTPSGMERFFAETLEPAVDRHTAPPQNQSAVASRYVTAAAKYGLEFAGAEQALAA
ncbi:MAG: cupin domain-containing protein [Bryobacteraceae bacterium]